MPPKNNCWWVFGHDWGKWSVDTLSVDAKLRDELEIFFLNEGQTSAMPSPARICRKCNLVQKKNIANTAGLSAGTL
jgi:hypothetical protein